ncbi:uncharacterized protein BP01DRAFT_298657 [Aspergillus saccharolyticus JOP 1030-1]|uniref:Uncharacterized protein n=1 Tax=Aspergillus saccharolyticus JOP 1030-1 TaxID=1450539 RepID=A0A318ZWG1_9EURO|nr:hypothetical protein BP01DRAFT_298657 [Aspergillus saccharolyticus JOP 1030-1]PYH44468.1 hypothetical protein BP01DRAFT_298657 [Aspergillus saccharolyticus JOP 1030-1]
MQQIPRTDDATTDGFAGLAEFPASQVDDSLSDSLSYSSPKSSKSNRLSSDSFLLDPSDKESTSSYRYASLTSESKIEAQLIHTQMRCSYNTKSNPIDKRKDYETLSDDVAVLSKYRISIHGQQSRYCLVVEWIPAENLELFKELAARR